MRDNEKVLNVEMETAEIQEVMEVEEQVLRTKVEVVVVEVEL